ncbi:MAG: DNA polymerase IV [Egibacteraceae bacterium]
MTRSARPSEPILHVDMDAFYASVEVRRDPSLAERPVLVGGRGGRGVVASASYEARRYGVTSAMPMARARRLCPDAVVLPPDFAAYQEASAALRAILESVTPLVEPLALDEAFLDVGGAVRLFGPPPVIGARLRERIRAELGLPASVGVAPNKFLAKLCSGKAKPDGLLHLRAAEARTFLDPLPVRDLWGVGERTAARLGRFGLCSVADVACAGEPTLARIVGRAAAAQLVVLARGEDPRPVTPNEPAKGMSAEETFDRDVDDPAVLRRELLRLSETLARRLRRAGVAGRTVTLKLRYANFQTITRSRTLEMATDHATQIHREVAALLDALRLERVRVRLVGVGVTNLVPAGAAARQLRLDALDDLQGARWAALERAADGARRRFGEQAVTRGALLDQEGCADTPQPTRDDVQRPGSLPP